MPYFPNVNLELWDYTESSTDFNSYYEPLREYVLTGVYPANFQPMSPSDSLKEFGEVLSDTYKIIINSDVSVNSRMLVRVEGQQDTYEIIGSPMKNTHFIPTKHIKLVVKKQRKPTTLSILENTES